jgi:hypothetical protein
MFSLDAVTRPLLVLLFPRGLLGFCLVRISECIRGNSGGALVIRIDIKQSWSMEW